MAEAIHVEIPHFHAIWEGAVDWRACAAVAVEVASAAREGRTPDTGEAKRIWDAMVAADQVSRDAQGHPTGAYLSNVRWALERRGYTHLDMIDYRDQPDLLALRQLLKDAGVAGDPVILLVVNGQALPDNEAGVAGHYVVSGGIDSGLGYLIANGDTRTGIAQHPAWPAFIPTNWARWSTLEAARISGAIRVHAKPAPSVPTTAVTPTTPPQVAQALAAVEAAAQALATAETALKALKAL